MIYFFHFLEFSNFLGIFLNFDRCAYADGCFTADQMILSAYSRGMASLETKKIRGSMAAVGLSYNKIRHRVPETIDVACHNGPDSCTISGPEEDITRFVSELKSQRVFAKEVCGSSSIFFSFEFYLYANNFQNQTRTC